jgi:N-acetylglutamate synthase-like GNAT family acetyltransferase
MNIRRATPLDISAILALLGEMHQNTEVPTSPINSERLVNKVSEAIHRGIVFVAMDDENLIRASIGGIAGSDWWSDQRHLGDLWFYVTPASRKSDAAYKLIKSFITAGKEAKIPVRLGHIFSGDLERKDKFFARLGMTKAGSVFVEA